MLVHDNGDQVTVRKGRTWPPEKPTATTPSWSPFERNLDGIVEGEVISRMDLVDLQNQV